MIKGLPLLVWPPRRQVLTILIYHRVLLAPDPLRPGEVVAADFDAQMQFIARHFAVLPLPEAVARLKQGSLPRRACCITFDDGYADNLTIALPILETYRLPATVFVAVGYLDGGRMFNDAVIDTLARSERTQLDLAELELGRHSLATLEDRRAAVAAILNRFRYLKPEVRDANVARLIELADCGPLPTDIMLTTGQVGELARRGVEIGGHTVAHTILTTLDDERARQEMAKGKNQLETITGRPVTSFAYPNGYPQRDYAARHAAMVREVGFELGVTTAGGVANRNSDVLQLPRFTPWGPLKWWGARLMLNAWTGKAAAVC